LAAVGPCQSPVDKQVTMPLMATTLRQEGRRVEANAVLEEQGRTPCRTPTAPFRTYPNHVRFTFRSAGEEGARDGIDPERRPIASRRH
jgi:hypothetical protein